MKTNYGEDRVADTEIDELIKEYKSPSGTVGKIYKNKWGRYYQIIEREFCKPTLSFIQDWVADQIIKSN